MGVQRHPVNPIHTPMIGLPGQKRPRHARPAKANTAGSLDATLIRASHAMPRTRPTEPTVSCNPGTQRTQLQRTWVAYGSNSFWASPARKVFLSPLVRVKLIILMKWIFVHMASFPWLRRSGFETACIQMNISACHKTELRQRLATSCKDMHLRACPQDFPRFSSIWIKNCSISFPSSWEILVSSIHRVHGLLENRQDTWCTSQLKTPE